MQASLFSRRTIRARGAAFAIALMAAGCGPQYEIDRPGTWRPTGANDSNLRAMAANPHDLSTGAAATTDRGNGATRAVTRLYVDRRRPLLDVSISKVAPSSSGGDSGGGSEGAGGGATSASTGGGGQ